MVNAWLNTIQFMLLPGRCVLCRASSGRDNDLCTSCEAEISKPWPHCRHCGLPTTIDSEFCGHCSRQHFSFERCVALAPYQQPIDKLITNFKYQRRMAAGKVLALLLAHKLQQQYHQDNWPQVLIPVPLHWRRQWRRGFNQAHYLAAILAAELDIPLQASCLERRNATPSQQGMDRRQRRRNLQHAFNVIEPPAHGHIALIDDVVTTGTTSNLLCKQLLKCGATRIDVWCLARTPSPQ
jgi:ComF family protein